MARAFGGEVTGPEEGAAPLTTTSYAVLGLLARRQWTTYELARQMQRSFRYFWPRAERRIYDEPKRLAAAGYVEGRHEVVGRRPRTCWQITPAGREALRDWLGQEDVAGPSLEFEGLLKAFLAENGTKDQLLKSLTVIKEAADRQSAGLTQMCAEIAGTDGGIFPERLHLNALAMQYLLDHSALTAAWAEQSINTVKSWHSTKEPGTTARRRALRFFARNASPS